MPISSPAESQTLLSHWLTIATSSTSVSCPEQLEVPEQHKSNNYTLSYTAQNFPPKYKQFKTKSLTGDIVETVVIIFQQMILIIPTDC